MDAPSGDRCSQGQQPDHCEPKCCSNGSLDGFGATPKVSSAGFSQQPMATCAPNLTPVGVKKQYPIAECLILAGGLRPHPLAQATGQSTLDLWITPTRTVLGAWIDHIAPLTGRPLRVVFGGGVPQPTAPEYAPEAVTIVREPNRYRGPAGVVRDQCASGDSSDTILVVEAARWLDGDLTEFLVAHASSGAAVTIATNPDKSPAGLYMLRRETLELVAERGFIDLKEQWLENVKQSGHMICVHELTHPGTRALQTHGQFLEAARIATMQESLAVRTALVA